MSKSPIMFISLLTQTRSSFLVHLLSSSVTVVRPGKQRHVCKGLVRVSKILSYFLHHNNTHLQYLFEGGLKEAVAHLVTVAVTLWQIPEAVCGMKRFIVYDNSSPQAEPTLARAPQEPRRCRSTYWAGLKKSKPQVARIFLAS